MAVAALGNGVRSKRRGRKERNVLSFKTTHVETARYACVKPSMRVTRSVRACGSAVARVVNRKNIDAGICGVVVARGMNNMK